MPGRRTAKSATWKCSICSNKAAVSFLITITRTVTAFRKALGDTAWPRVVNDEVMREQFSYPETEREPRRRHSRVVNDEVKVVLREQFSYPETERELGYAVQRNLYYKISDALGNIRTYTVMTAENKEALHFYAGDLQNGDAVTVHFEGYTSSFDIQHDPETTPEK